VISAYGRKAHVLAVWLFVAGVLVQGYLAGQALAQLGGSGDFEAHITFGYTVMGLLALALLVTALIGRIPRQQVGLSVALLVLYVVQTGLPSARDSSPAIAALHPLNAMVMLVIGCVAGWRAWRLVSPVSVA
jgi:hypothetical protein